MRTWSLIAFWIAILFHAPAIASPRSDASPADVKRLLDCRLIGNDAARLACFDKQSAIASSAIERHDLVFIDREQARAVRRDRFGLSSPDFGGLFGDSRDQINQISSSVTGATINGNGSLQVRLADGSVWVQTDDRTLEDVRPGAKVVVKRGAMSSYWVAIEGIASFKAKRIG